MRWLGAAAAALLVFALAAGFVARFGVLTETGRGLLVAPLEGLPLGPLGKLHIEGLTGDIWRDFRLRRLTIVDSQGAWLDARDIAVRWRSIELLKRRVHIESLTAANVRILRRPSIGGGGESASSRLPVSLRIDRLQLRLETSPAFSVRPGAFRIGARLDVERSGGLGGAVDAVSLLHAGDGLKARFDFGLRKRIKLDAHGFEGRGGALAGLLGLTPDRAFRLDARADGGVGDGVVKARALSGGGVIAEADGDWSRGGGALTARLSLAPSSWTARFSRALGPEIRLTAQTRPANGKLQAVSAQLAADNAVARLSGMVDPAKIAAPNGFVFQALVRDLGRMVQTPSMGRLTADGILTADTRGWRLAGKASVEHVSAYDYALARVEGPFQLQSASREIRLKADLRGQAGEGRGVLAAAAGARPYLLLDASRLADGRILLRSIKAEGAGFALDASGERGLLGGLTFKGDLNIANLAAAHAGAHGAVEARWTASQTRARQPWSFSIDAKGDKLASGEAQVDRLLGEKPRLTATARYQSGVITVTKASLDGAAVKAAAVGAIDHDDAVKLALTWSAAGPFDVGPLEIGGKISGGGDVAGSLSAPRAELTADFEKIDLPGVAPHPAHLTLSAVKGAHGANGQFAVTTGKDAGSAHVKAGFHFVDDQLALDDIDAAAGGVTASGSLSLRGRDLSAADLRLTAVPGAFLTEGRVDGELSVADHGGGPVGDLRLAARNLAPRGYGFVLTNAQLTASGLLSKAAYRLAADGFDGDVPFHLDGSGMAGEQGASGSVSFAGAGRIRTADFHTLTPALINIDGPDASLRLDLSYGGGTADVSLRQTREALAGNAHLSGVDLTALGEDLVGRISGDLTLDGQGPRLNGVLDAKLTGVRGRDAPPKLALDGALHAALADQRLTIDASADGTQPGDRASVNLTLPAEASAAPFRVALIRTRPIGGRFDINADLQPLWNLFYGGDRTLGGKLAAKGDIAGTIADPRPIGHASLTDGRFEDAATGLKMRALTAEADLRDNVVSVTKFSGQDAKSGVLSGQGIVSLAPGGSSSLTMAAKSFQLFDTDGAKATASGAVTVTRGGDGRAKLSGQLTIDRADISAESGRRPPGVLNLDVVEINRPAGARQSPAAPLTHAPAVNLDIKLRAARGIFVKGLGLNAEMSLDASVTGTTANPVLSGEARVVRGDYDLAGKRFEIDDAGVITLASSPDRIKLDLTAKLDDPTLTATIKISGTADKPQITLSSVPVLPSDEILSQVLFGASAAQLSPVQAAELAAAVTTLATGGGLDVMGGLKNFARLDRLALGGGDPTTGVTVSGGKYIGKNVYLELTGGGRQGPSAQVEVRANRSFSVVSQIGGEPGAKLSVRWRQDYGKPKTATSKATPSGKP